MNKRPELDTVNPPGQLTYTNQTYTGSPQQVKYLRDVIRKYQEEDNRENRKEGPYNALKGQDARMPLPDAEKRLARRKQVLLTYLDGDEFDVASGISVRMAVKAIIKENT